MPDETERLERLQHRALFAFGLVVGVLVTLVCVLLAGCGNADTPRELYDAPTACRSLNGGCEVES